MAAPCFTKAQGQVLLHKLPIQLTECKCSTGSWHRRQLFWQVSALIHQTVKVLTVGSRWTLSVPTTATMVKLYNPATLALIHTNTQTRKCIHKHTQLTHTHTGKVFTKGLHKLTRVLAVLRMCFHQLGKIIRSHQELLCGPQQKSTIWILDPLL